MRSDLNEFVTKYLTLIGAALMLFGFVAFVMTAYDADQAQHSVTTPTLESLPSTANN
jgi:predicted tellurium resistance membrane protein TerC